MIVYAKTCGLLGCERPVLSVQSQALYCSREHTRKAKDARKRQRIREDPERHERERERQRLRTRDRHAYHRAYYRSDSPGAQRKRSKLVSTRRQRAQAKLVKAQQGKPSGTPWYYGHCVRCAQPFLTKSKGGLLPSYCSDRCKTRDRKDRHEQCKRLAYAEPVYRRQVFERDDWECQLCGLHLQADDHTRHDYATIDHIIPLAAGGLHSMTNVQAACGRCNSHKSDLVL